MLCARIENITKQQSGEWACENCTDKEEADRKTQPEANKDASIIESRRRKATN